MVICVFVKWYGCEYPPIWRPVLSLFYPPVIIRGKNGKNSESPVGSNKNEKRKPKSAVYRSFWASVVYFHLRLISTKSHKREMTRNAVDRKVSRVRIPNSPPQKACNHADYRLFYFCPKDKPARSSVFKGENQLFSPALIELQRLLKSPPSGRASPVSIACAEVILDL